MGFCSLKPMRHSLKLEPRETSCSRSPDSRCVRELLVDWPGSDELDLVTFTLTLIVVIPKPLLLCSAGEKAAESWLQAIACFIVVVYFMSGSAIFYSIYSAESHHRPHKFWCLQFMDSDKWNVSYYACMMPGPKYLNSRDGLFHWSAKLIRYSSGFDSYSGVVLGMEILSWNVQGDTGKE